MSEHGSPPIKITSIIILCVALFVAAMYLYEPLTIKRQISKLDSIGPDADEAVEYLAPKDRTIEDFLVAAIPERPGAFRWNALRILEKRGALNRMPETLVLNYIVVKDYFLQNALDPSAYVLTTEDFCNGFFPRIQNMLGAKYIGAVLVFDNEISGHRWLDMLDHEWVLGLRHIILREHRGYKCIGNMYEMKDVENAIARFDAISQNGNDSQFSYEVNAKMSWETAYEGCRIYGMVINFQTPLPYSITQEDSNVVPKGARLIDFYSIGSNDGFWFTIWLTLLGYDFEIRDNKIILKSAAENAIPEPGK